MARFSRKELDELGAVAVKAVKQTAPELNQKDMQKLFGRLYSNIYKQNKLDKTPEKTTSKSHKGKKNHQS